MKRQGKGAAKRRRTKRISKAVGYIQGEYVGATVFPVFFPGVSNAFDPSDPAALLHADADLFTKKSKDYAPGSDPFENFNAAARFASRLRSRVGDKELDGADACAILIGVKLSRLETLGKREAANESVADTLRDLRVYLAIYEAMQ